MRHLKAFHVFHIAAQSSSYSEAAKKLYLTHGAISKQIKVLEQHLQKPLFIKQGRRMQLTAQGKVLKHYTDVAFDALDNGAKQVISMDEHHLEVSCEPTLTMRWLMPRLSQFHQSTGIDVRLSTAGGSIALNENGLSMAIRRDDFDIPEDYGVHPLVEEWVGPVMSAAYWDKVQADLTKMTLLHSETRASAWQDWSQHSCHVLPVHPFEKTFEHFYFCLQAAADGLGAAMGSYPLVADDLACGRLIAPLGFILSGHHYILLSCRNELVEDEAQFLAWLQDCMRRSCPEGLSGKRI
ncbi:LysR family transcriptional regulator [Agarivorans sp. Z349TD_8]|uniref:LysR family transcriptional regulator n=1 Tax=Agarivorans sp. Z349TD_8 TaxID=3421434 RepID=UPI003D7C8444